jgi:hypothetical protein
MLFAVGLSPSVASGQATLATANDGVLGELREPGIAAGGAYYLRYRLTANRSYYAVCWDPFRTDGASGCITDWRNPSDLSVQAIDDMEPFSIGPYGDGDTVKPTTSGVFYVRVDNSDAISARTIHVMVIESTIFSPWLYVLGASGYDSYVEIRNNAAQTNSMTVRAYNNTGSVVGSTTVNVAGNGTALVTMSSIVPDGTAGSASITYNGQPGTVSANITTLSAATGLSFDAPFTPRMTWATWGF